MTDTTSAGKLYLHADETGKGERHFIVAVVITAAAARDALERSLVSAERQSGRHAKWTKTTPSRRSDYLHHIAEMSPSFPLLGYRIHETSSANYDELTQQTILAAIRLCPPPDNSEMVIVVDALTPAQRQNLGRFLRQHRLPFRLTIRGGRDESSPLLRLADGLAGFIRHVNQGEEYAKTPWKRLQPLLRSL